MNLNYEIFKLINGLAYKNKILDTTMIIFSKYVPLIFMAALAVFYLYGVVKKRESLRTIAVDTFAITVINLLLSFIIGKIYFEPRPFVTRKVNLLIPHVPDASFPSDHAIGTMSIALGINKYRKVYGAFFMLLSIVVGISRVYVGHHYPMDVIGGYLLVILVNFLYEKLVSNRIVIIYKKIENLLIKFIPANRSI